MENNFDDMIRMLEEHVDGHTIVGIKTKDGDYITGKIYTRSNDVCLSDDDDDYEDGSYIEVSGKKNMVTVPDSYVVSVEIVGNE